MLPALNFAFDESTTPREIRIRMVAGARPVGTIFFRSETTVLVPTADALLCLGLKPALEVFAPLRIDGEVEPTLFANADAVQELLCSWHPFYRRIPMSTSTASRHYPDGRGTALYFSGGIDSSYSLALEKDGLDALITIVDANAPGQGGAGARRLVGSLGRTAATYGLEPIVIESNVRAMMHPFLGWIEFHGSAMAAIRHMLCDRFETVLIASSGDEEAWHIPWGSHPVLDPLLGSGGARIVHHGLVKRLDKVRTILTQPPLMERLHVCNVDPQVNCGRCSKCRFAIACLSVLDALDQSPSFPRDLEDTPNHFNVEDDSIRSDHAYLRAAAAATGRHQGLVADIDRALAAYDVSKSRRSLFAADIGRRLNRAKHRARYWRASR